MSLEENKAIIRRYVEEMNNRNDAYLDQHFTSQYVYHGPSADLDKDAFIEFHNAMLATFPDARMTVLDQVAEGDKVTTRWELQGTHRGEALGIAPTGRRVAITGIIISRFEGGKVAEEWEESDMLGLMEQIATVPTPA